MGRGGGACARACHVSPNGTVHVAWGSRGGGRGTAEPLNLHPSRIISVNLQEGTMDVNAWLRLHWVDPRLAWNATEWGVSKLFVNNPELRVGCPCRECAT